MSSLKNLEKNKFIIYLLLGSALVILMATSTIYLSKNKGHIDNDDNQVSINPTEKRMIRPNIDAAHAIVWDKKTNQILYSKNAQDTYPIASITKIITAMIGVDTIPESTIITIYASDLATEGESGLLLGEQWNRNDLIHFMLLTSSNDAASAIARTARQQSNIESAVLYDQLLDKIGTPNVRINNPTGLDTIDGISASNYASAADIVLIMNYFLTNYPEVANQSGDKSQVFTTNFKTHTARTTNILADQLPHVDSAKTGYTLVAGGNLAVVVEIGPLRPVFIVVLGSSQSGRFSEVEKLYNYAESIIQAS